MEKRELTELEIREISELLAISLNLPRDTVKAVFTSHLPERNEAQEELEL
jgi:hypothetical protein